MSFRSSRFLWNYELMRFVFLNLLQWSSDARVASNEMVIKKGQSHHMVGKLQEWKWWLSGVIHGWIWRWLTANYGEPLAHFPTTHWLLTASYGEPLGTSWWSMTVLFSAAKRASLHMVKLQAQHAEDQTDNCTENVETSDARNYHPGFLLTIFWPPPPRLI